MRGKSYGTSINESPSNSEHQTLQTNPYENTNVNQQQKVIYATAPEEPPPAYFTAIQSPSHPTPQFENNVQNSSLNNSRPQVTYITHNHRLGRHSADILCPNCGTTVHTRAETSSTIITILVALLLFFFCFCLALIPFCIPSFKRTTHYCPNCNCVLGEIREFQ